MKDIDPVSLGIMWDRLISITNEIVSALVRTSFSTIVRESLDLSVVVFDANGSSLAQGRMSAPGHSGTAPLTIRHLLRRFPRETLQPGDLFITNDPWMGTGHLFDMNFIRPVFRGAELVGFTFSDTHLPDIGGSGFTANGTDMYQEGLHLPFMRLFRAGVLDEELLDMIRVNVRVSDQVVGDIMANVTCNELGGRLLLEFMDEYGIDDLAPLSRTIIAQTERAMRENIARIPDGSYPRQVRIEGWDEPLTLACVVTVEGDGIHIDFSGSSAPVAGGINVPLCYTRAMAIHAIRLLTVPDIPSNEGSTNPVTFTVPEDCILNAQPPAPTAGRHVVGHFVTPLVFAALADVLPDRVQADCGMLNIINVQGRHRDGREVSTVYFASGGYGAMDGMDGIHTLPSPANMKITPAEVWENLTSLTVESKRLIPDSGGAGEFRGGLGQEIVLRNDSGHPFSLAFFGRQTDFAPAGLKQGLSGGVMRFLIDGETVEPTGQSVLAPGSRLVILQPGGGGFGDPHSRAPEKVRQDVRDGYVSIEAAEFEYGVRIEP